ncbi:MAG: hypothetical protein F4121_02885 [Acidimicrobiia bacterium]|nr:hypothetical protein [Acidimicrobiia bacterium]
MVQVIGCDGQLTVDLQRELLTRYRVDQGEVTVPLAADAGAYDCAGPIDALVALARGDTVANNSPGDLGVRTVEIIEAAYRSARSGRAESVA